MTPRSFGRQWDKAGPDDLANKLGARAQGGPSLDVERLRRTLEEIASWHDCDDPASKCIPDSGPNCQAERYGSDAVQLARAALGVAPEPPE